MKNFIKIFNLIEHNIYIISTTYILKMLIIKKFYYYILSLKHNNKVIVCKQNLMLLSCAYAYKIIFIK